MERLAINVLGGLLCVFLAFVPGSASAERPLILIPGALATELLDPSTGREAWPGPVALLPFRTYRDLSVDISGKRGDRLVAGNVIRRIGVSDYYQGLLRTLQEDGGYVLGEPGVPQVGRRVIYLFPYDWRQSNARHAAKLLDLIEQIRRDHDDPRLKVDILAHSNGGVIAAYFIGFGPQDVDSSPVPWGRGEQYVDRALLFGTPSRGTVSAVAGLLSGHHVGLRRIPVEVAATFQSVYELLPAASEGAIVGVDGRSSSIDLHEVELWERNGWGLFDERVRRRVERRHEAGKGPSFDRLVAEFRLNMARGRRFSAAMALVRDNQAVPIVSIGASCVPTLGRAVLEKTRNGGGRLLLSRGALDQAHLSHSLVLVPGDGLIASSSAMPISSQNGRTIDRCAAHAGIASSSGVPEVALELL